MQMKLKHQWCIYIAYTSQWVHCPTLAENAFHHGTFKCYSFHHGWYNGEGCFTESTGGEIPTKRHSTLLCQIWFHSMKENEAISAHLRIPEATSMQRGRYLKLKPPQCPTQLVRNLKERAHLNALQGIWKSESTSTGWDEATLEIDNEA